jgi:hypothetical protein
MRAIANLPLPKQFVQNSFELGKNALKVRNDDKSFDAAPAPQQEREIPDSMSLLRIREVVLRHRSTDYDATAHGHIRKDGIQRRSTHIVKKQVDAGRA